MRRCVGILAVTILLAGCGSDRSGDNAPTNAAPAATTPGTTSTTSVSAQEPTAESGTIPDPCTLLSDAEVTQLTGREITQIDKDGEEPTAPVRFCQWQQPSGQLAVFLTRTTQDDFTVEKADTPSIPGIGDDAYWRDGHLYVLVKTIGIDVYSRGGEESQNQVEAEKVATALLPKVQSFA